MADGVDIDLVVGVLLTAFGMLALFALAGMSSPEDPDTEWTRYKSQQRNDDVDV